jgi:hypothetical protein
VGAQVAVRCDPQMRNEYLHRCHSKAKGIAKVAAARKLAIRLYWMLRTQRPYPEIVHVERSSRAPLASASQAAGLIGRSRPDASRDSHRRIMVDGTRFPRTGVGRSTSRCGRYWGPAETTTGGSTPESRANLKLTQEPAPYTALPKLSFRLADNTVVDRQNEPQKAFSYWRFAGLSVIAVTCRLGLCGGVRRRSSAGSSPESDVRRGLGRKQL